VCQTIAKVPEIADYEAYLDDHGFPVTTIRPRPIVAAAIAVHTDCSGAPLASFRVVFKA
jgi:hypothetical protein